MSVLEAYINLPAPWETTMTYNRSGPLVQGLDLFAGHRVGNDIGTQEEDSS